nr:MAG TPA: hypothetical protein [Caudoviricetes sp.]
MISSFPKDYLFVNVLITSNRINTVFSPYDVTYTFPINIFSWRSVLLNVLSLCL